MMRPFIVAEMSANHLGSYRRAMELVDAAAAAGADAIKLQTWSRGTMCVSNYELTHGPWAGRSLRDLYEEAFTPWEWHRPIFERARRLGMIPFSAAFDLASVDFLEALGVDRHKVASFELTDIPLIRHMASKRKPMILSTGMATLAEIGTAVAECHQLPLTILRCTSAYPAPASDARLLRDFAGTWPWGLSDHSQGIGLAVAAVALGATMIEKHLTLARADGGPDAGFSMEPHEFKQLVIECRRAAEATARTDAPIYGPTANESTELRRSLWVVQDIKQGEPLILHENVATARPAHGLAPATDLTGRRAARDLRAGEPLTLECMS